MLFAMAYDYLSNCKQKPDLPFKLTKKDTAKAPAGGLGHFAWHLDGATQSLLGERAQEWIRDPSQFWEQPNPLIFSLKDPQQLVIRLCLEANTNVAHSRIIRRVCCVVLYQLRATWLKKDDAGTIARAIVTQPHRPDDLEELTRSIRSLLRAGAKYENISRRLGVGSLFLLGNEVSDYTSVSVPLSKNASLTIV